MRADGSSCSPTVPAHAALPCTHAPSRLATAHPTLLAQHSTAEQHTQPPTHRLLPNLFVVLHNPHALQRHQAAVGVGVYHLPAQLLYALARRGRSAGGGGAIRLQSRLRGRQQGGSSWQGFQLAGVTDGYNLQLAAAGS